MMKKIIFLMIIVAVAGCANVTRTSLNEEIGYTEELAERYVADGEWWKAYNDAELDRLIELALENNTDLAQSGINITKALYTARNAGVDL